MVKVLDFYIAGGVEEKYTGIRAKLASEKLLERDGIRVSKEKLRQIMMVHGYGRGKGGEGRPIRGGRGRIILKR